MSSIDEPILVTGYDATWPMLFAAERSRVRNACGDSITRIEHFGGTAVPGSAAKPIVDLLVGVRNLDAFGPHLAKLDTIGYVHFGPVFTSQRWYSRRRGPPHFNLAIAVDGGEFWRSQLKLRDYLRAHPDEVSAYSDCKRRLFDNGSRTFVSYSQAKASFATALMERVKAWEIEPRPRLEPPSIEGDSCLASNPSSLKKAEQGEGDAQSATNEADSGWRVAGSEKIEQ